MTVRIVFHQLEFDTALETSSASPAPLIVGTLSTTRVSIHRVTTSMFHLLPCPKPILLPEETFYFGLHDLWQSNSRYPEGVLLDYTRFIYCALPLQLPPVEHQHICPPSWSSCVNVPAPLYFALGTSRKHVVGTTRARGALQTITRLTRRRHIIPFVDEQHLRKG